MRCAWDDFRADWANNMRTLIAFMLACGLLVGGLIVGLWGAIGGAPGSAVIAPATILLETAKPESATIDPADGGDEDLPPPARDPVASSLGAGLVSHDSPATPSAAAPPTTAPKQRIRGETHWPQDRESLRRRYADATAALSKEPDNRNALRDAIDAGLELEDYDAVFPLQLRFVALEPGEIAQLAWAARVALDLGRWLDAIDLLNRCVAGQPKEPRHRFDLAVAHTALGHLHEARLQWEAYLALQPADREARFHLGVTLLDLHEWQLAAEAFAELIRIDPKQQDAQLNLMLALHRLDRWTDLIAATDKFIADNGPQIAVLNRAAELLWQAAETDGAPRAALLQQVVSYADRSLALEPDQPAIRGLMRRADTAKD